jgi:hypothetical protein
MVEVMSALQFCTAACSVFTTEYVCRKIYREEKTATEEEETVKIMEDRRRKRGNREEAKSSVRNNSSTLFSLHIMYLIQTPRRKHVSNSSSVLAMRKSLLSRCLAYLGGMGTQTAR